MGEAADDVFDAAMYQQSVREGMRLAKCIPCPNCRVNLWLKDIECPTCHDLGWIDDKGEPCEI